jgi:hypothetical protein
MSILPTALIYAPQLEYAWREVLVGGGVDDLAHHLAAREDNDDIDSNHNRIIMIIAVMIAHVPQLEDAWREVLGGWTILPTISLPVKIMKSHCCTLVLMILTITIITTVMMIMVIISRTPARGRKA